MCEEKCFAGAGVGGNEYVALRVQYVLFFLVYTHYKNLPNLPESLDKVFKSKD